MKSSKQASIWSWFFSDTEKPAHDKKQTRLVHTDQKDNLHVRTKSRDARSRDVGTIPSPSYGGSKAPMSWGQGVRAEGEAISFDKGGLPLPPLKGIAGARVGGAGGKGWEDFIKGRGVEDSRGERESFGGRGPMRKIGGGEERGPDTGIGSDFPRREARAHFSLDREQGSREERMRGQLSSYELQNHFDTPARRAMWDAPGFGVPSVAALGDGRQAMGDAPEVGVPRAMARNGWEGGVEGRQRSGGSEGTEREPDAFAMSERERAGFTLGARGMRGERGHSNLDLSANLAYEDDHLHGAAVRRQASETPTSDYAPVRERGQGGVEKVEGRKAMSGGADAWQDLDSMVFGSASADGKRKKNKLPGINLWGLSVGYLASCLSACCLYLDHEKVSGFDF